MGLARRPLRPRPARSAASRRSTSAPRSCSRTRYQAIIDEHGAVVPAARLPAEHRRPRAPRTRFRSLLFEPGGDDFYGVIRTDVLRRVTPLDSYHHADRTYPGRAGPARPVPPGARAAVLPPRPPRPRRTRQPDHPRARCANLDPRRANPVRNPTVAPARRVHLGFVHRHPPRTALRRATSASAYRTLAPWLTNRARPGHGGSASRTARRTADEPGPSTGRRRPRRQAP